MKYKFFKWYKTPKRGLFTDGSATGVLLRNGKIWYFSNTEVLALHYHQLKPTHFMIFPGVCLSWMGPNHTNKFISKL